MTGVTAPSSAITDSTAETVTPSAEQRRRDNNVGRLFNVATILNMTGANPTGALLSAFQRQ